MIERKLVLIEKMRILINDGVGCGGGGEAAKWFFCF